MRRPARSTQYTSVSSIGFQESRLIHTRPCRKFIKEVKFTVKFLQTKFQKNGGWSGGAMVLGKLPVPGRPLI